MYGLVAALIGVALAGPPALGALDPEVLVGAAHLNQDAHDPWGTPWKLAPWRPGAWGDELYSCGPNRVDEQGQGDDVRVATGPDGRVLFYRFGTEGLFGLAVALAVMWEVLRVALAMLRAARGPLAQEVTTCGLLAVGPTLALVVLVLAAATLLGQREALDSLGATLLVPLKVALPASVYLAVFAGLLAFRLRGPGPESPGGTEGPGPGRPIGG